MFYSGVFGYFSFVSLYCTPTNPGSFVWFSSICSRKGGLTAAVLALDTAEDYDRVGRSPVRLCSKDGKVCYYRRLEYDFLFLCLASFFFPSFSPSLLRYVSLLRIASSVKQSSAPRQQIPVYLLCHLYSALSQN